MWKSEPLPQPSNMEAKPLPCVLDPNIGSSTQGNGFASMLLGWGSGSDFHVDPKAFSRAGYWGFFGQDDWKITRKLTLNLGLRYEFEVPRTEVFNRYSYWDLNAKSPISVPGYDLRGVMKFKLVAE